MLLTSVVTIKGQIVIPAVLRRKVGMKQGTKVFMEEREGDIVVHPLTSGFYDRACGILKGGGLVRLLERSRRADKEKEEKKIGHR